ncbi:replication protein A 70 kDa DNA-binding subunit-like [Tetranychus urticae]|uniref:replication protein A 70 kDa DNA-binding subunit-like n=1 Tax=Tetranychus urticae TaxID=32264 RepID=UPI000D654946|nr:replication protein A 70 kDa DNA-binding subunit-like [Tetranychus urticae]
MTLPKLTEGAFEKILSGCEMDSPIVQLLAQKNASATSVNRLQVLLSDGNVSYQFCLIVGPLVLRVETAEFGKFSVIRLLKYYCKQTNHDKRVIIITEAEVVTPGAVVGLKLGNPSIVTDFSKELDSNAQTLDHQFGGKSSGAIKFASQFNDVPVFKEEQICPVSQITPYVKNWVLRGRVTSKSTVVSWNNVKGSGKLFTFNLADHSGEIKITAFRGECDKYFDVVILGKVHILFNAVVKEANKK